MTKFSILLITLICWTSSSFHVVDSCSRNTLDSYGFVKKYNKWLKHGIKLGYTSNPKIHFFTNTQTVLFNSYNNTDIIEDFQFLIKSIKEFKEVDFIKLDRDNLIENGPIVNFYYSSIYTDKNGTFYAFFKINGLNASFFGYLFRDKKHKIKLNYFQLVD